MTDFEYDCMQKKRIANSARNRKCGSKSKKCTLPSDRLTHKEWKERCGAVMSYNFGSPMCWEDFKKMPVRIQAEYITNLQSKYCATATDLAKMFGIKPLTVSRHVVSKNLDVEFHRGKSMTASQREAWAKFLNGELNTTEVEEEVSDDSLCDVPEEAEEIVSNEELSKSTSTVSATSDPEKVMTMRKFSLQFDGAIDIDSIANSLRLILGNQASGTIEIACILN